MRITHFEAFAPLCPRCLSVRSGEHPVTIGTITAEQNGDILEGILHCPACLMEYPILDGIPYLLADLRSFVRENLSHLLARTDVSPVVESLLGDASGPGTHFEVARQFISSYTWDHWADLDPEEPPSEPAPGGVARHLDTGLTALGSVAEGLTLDLGCSVGRSTFELAERRPGLVLGADLNVPMLRLARRILTSGEVAYGRRRVGIVYDARRFSVPLPGADRVDFWAFNAVEPPFAAGMATLVTAFNLLDCVPSALAFLTGVERVLADGGAGLVTTPYDWSAGATPYESWIGGHSQRGPWGGASEPFVRALLTPGAHPQSLERLRLEVDMDVPWHVRMHSRSTVLYRSHLVGVRRVGG